MFKKTRATGYTEVIEGVHLKTMVYGAQTLLTEVRLEKGAVIVNGEHHIAKPGDSWNLAGNTEHGATALEESVVVEVFSPVREDYLPYFTATKE